MAPGGGAPGPFETRCQAAYLEGNAKVFLAGRLRRRVMIHAGVVTWRGAAIVLPGASGAGKTSLVIELVRLGARYYSDEFAIVDAGGRVFPYARPLCVRRRPGSLAVRVPWQSLVSGLRAQRPPRRGVPVALWSSRGTGPGPRSGRAQCPGEPRSCRSWSTRSARARTRAGSCRLRSA